MRPSEARSLKVGDLVHHKDLPVMNGVVAKVEGPFFTKLPPWVTPVSARFRIYWKGWNEFDLDATDWTWDYNMEKGNVPQKQVKKDEPYVSPQYIADNYGRCRRTRCLCLESGKEWKGTKCPAWVPVDARNVKDLEKELANDFEGTVTKPHLDKTNASV